MKQKIQVIVVSCRVLLLVLVPHLSQYNEETKKRKIKTVHKVFRRRSYPTEN